jgi:hypothetical protein
LQIIARLPASRPIAAPFLKRENGPLPIEFRGVTIRQAVLDDTSHYRISSE